MRGDLDRCRSSCHYSNQNPYVDHDARKDRLDSCEDLLVAGGYLHNRMGVFYFGQEDSKSRMG